MHDSNTRNSARTRRTFLTWAISGLGTFAAALVGVPILGTLLAPTVQRPRGPSWIDFGPVDAIAVGVPRLLTAVTREQDGWYERSQRQAVWVVRSDGDALTVFAPWCTHLGCAYRWDPQQTQFACPCHGGTYAITGQVTGGPPPRGLTRLSFKIEHGNLHVRFAAEEAAS